MTAILEKQLILRSHKLAGGENERWYETRIPFFTCPDPVFEKLWYYRWEVVRRHLKFVSDEVGYIFTEFQGDEAFYWAGEFNTIVAASDHHVNEARWLRDPQYVQQYMRFWLTHPGAQPQSYSSALADSIWRILEVHGGMIFASDLIDSLIANHRRWIKGRVAYPHDNGYNSKRGLFWNTGRDSTGEYNLPSAQLNEPLRGIQGYKIRGGAGYRPDNNADMYADALAISRIAELAGRYDEAQEFADRAKMLKYNVQENLWDPSREFFVHRWLRDEYSEADRHGAPSIRAGSMIWETNADRFGGVGHQSHERGEGRGRELVGYLPWYRGLPDDEPKYASAWRYLLDTEYFYAPFGPTTAERHDPWFDIQYDCRTNGNSFPLNTSRVLNGLANLLHDYKHHGVLTEKAYFDLLSIYARTQYRDGKPYLAEFHHPDKDCWTVDRPIGKHYFHSSFCDLIITGLIGLRPRADGGFSVRPLTGDAWDYFVLEDLPWQGHRLSIVYDRDNSRYGRGQGLTVWVDGQCTAQAPDLRLLEIDVESPDHPAAVVVRG